MAAIAVGEEAQYSGWRLPDEPLMILIVCTPCGGAPDAPAKTGQQI
jgi:hypothetical protein